MIVCFAKSTVLLVVFIATFLIFSADAGAINEYWVSDADRVEVNTRNPRSNNENVECYGRWEQVHLEDETRTGCVYGNQETTKFVTYQVSFGVIESALMLSGSDFYIPTDVCRYWGCVYSSFSDTLFVPRPSDIYVIRNISYFSDHTENKKTRNLSGAPSTHIAAPSPALQNSSRPVAMVASMNQQWLGVEVTGNVYLVIDSLSLAARRIEVKPFGLNKSVKSIAAISDNGARLALISDDWNIMIIQMDACQTKMSTVSLGCLYLFPSILVPIKLDTVRNVRFSSDTKLLTYQWVKPAELVHASTLRSKPVGIPQPATSVDYIALGDSFSSGEGEESDFWYMRGSNTQNERCHTSSRAYSTILGTTWGLRTRTIACSGARFRDVYTSEEYKGQADRLRDDGDDESVASVQERQASALSAFMPGRVPQIDFVSRYKPKFITIGIGGNDAGFSSKLKACFSLGTCNWAKDGEWRRAAAREIDNLAPAYRDIFSRLRNASPDSSITAIGYPVMMSENQFCLSTLGLMFNTTERRFVAMATRRLNGVIARSAGAEGLRYVDINDAYNGARLCDGVGTVAINSVRTGDDMNLSIGKLSIPLLGAESFHPTAVGHTLTASNIVNKYSRDEFFSAASTATVGMSTSDRAYWGSDAEIANAPLMKNEVFLKNNSLTIGDSVTISLEKHSFRRSTRVSIELHSQPVILTQMLAGLDGELEGTVTIPFVSEGYHTVFAKGINGEGDEVRYYTDIHISEGGHALTGSDDVSDPAVAVDIKEGDDGYVLGSTSQGSASVVFPTTLTSTSIGMTTAKLIGNAGAVVIMLISTFVVVLTVISGYNKRMNIRKVVKKLIPTSLFRRIEPFGHLVEAILANVRYGFPARKLKIIGVTGTNGKTTTSFMIHRLLHEAGINVAITTTVGYGIGDDIKPQIAHITTAQAGILQKRLRNFARAGVEWVVVETSSHALAQYRTWGVPYEVAVLTNITHDHLDYHGNFKNYANAKRRLFRIANKHGRRFGVVNADDASSKLFAKVIKRSLSYGLEKGDLRASGIDLQSDGSSFIATVKGDSYSLRVNIPGQFNVSNALAAVAVGRELGLTKKQIEKGIAALKGVEGRMNVISEGQSFKVLVDFASTPDGFEKFFESVRPLVKGKLIAVFGSAGRRDESKRAVQGAIAGKYADVVVVTEEDDRDDDGARILKQIASGAKKSGKVEGKTLYIEPSRENAIGFAMTLATTRDDTVVLLGKGHEKTIERADGEYPWSDTEVARTALHELLKKSQ